MSASSEIGRLLGGRFRIKRFIAEGGMGAVFEGVDEENGGARVAIKLLHARFAGDQELLARLRREVGAAMDIRSPHVARVLRGGTDRTRRGWIVFEFLEGESLEERLAREGNLPFAEVAWMIEHALRGLGAAHDVGVVHRDVKPANLFLERGVQRLRVVDFGLAKRLRNVVTSAPGSLATAATHSAPLTQIGDVLGTPAYMSVEQLEDSQSIDARTDIYSVALIAYRMLTGSLPYERRDVTMLYTLKRMGYLPSLTSATRLAWPDAIEDWIRCAAARERGERFDSAHAALTAWVNAAGTMKDHSLAPAALDRVQEDTDIAPPPSSGATSTGGSLG